MTANPGQGAGDAGEGPSLEMFAEAAASDLDILASLHDREPTAAIVEALQMAPIQEQLGLVLASDAARSSLAAFALAVEDLPKPVTQAALDELAGGYADIYLRHGYRASPEESVWLTEDGLQRQAPMFEVREWYRRHNLKATDWANRADDHLVVQLRFIARLLAKSHSSEDLAEVARFLDAHLLRWSRRFAVRLVQHEAPNWYAALALLTASYADELRDHIPAMTGLARPAPDESKGAARKAAVAEIAAPYMPGVAPSW